MTEKLQHYKYLSKPVVQWKQYSNYLVEKNRLEIKLSNQNKEINTLKEKLKSKEISIQSILNQMNDFRSRHDHELTVNKLLKKQIRELKNELQKTHNQYGKKTDVKVLTNVGDQ